MKNRSLISWFMGNKRSVNETLPAEQTVVARERQAWCVVNKALGDLVLISQSDLSVGSSYFLWQVRAAGEGTGFGLFFDRSEAETVAAFCNLMAKRTGPSNWIGMFEVTEAVVR